ncbi:hypothetical protein [Mycobacterium sp.]|uniref:hypothetical protein n=1 Tax=Mycobacterium sp. TaxID=1785 RepID=UPI003F9DE2E8
MIFVLPAAWLHAPRLGLFGYLLALTIAVFTAGFLAGPRLLIGSVVLVVVAGRVLALGRRVRR